MKNSPDWPEQTWAIPCDWNGQLVRKENHWQIEYGGGSIRILLSAMEGERIADAIVRFYDSENRKAREGRK